MSRHIPVTVSSIAARSKLTTGRSRGLAGGTLGAVGVVAAACSSAAASSSTTKAPSSGGYGY